MDKINLDFIQAGKTTREEVTAKLGGTDTGIKDKQLFVGRWAISQWGVLWMWGTGYSGGAGWNRGWARHSILISFDDKDVVQQFRQFPDEDLVNQLSAWVAQGHGQPLDLSAPMEVRVGHRHGSAIFYGGTFILENDSFAYRESTNSLTYRESNNHGKHDFKISPKQIKEIGLASIGHGDKSDPQFIHETIHFTEKTKVGGKMTIEVDVPTVLTLVKYLAQTRPSRKLPNWNPVGNNSSASIGTPAKAFTYIARPFGAVHFDSPIISFR